MKLRVMTIALVALCLSSGVRLASSLWQPGGNITDPQQRLCRGNRLLRARQPVFRRHEDR